VKRFLHFDYTTIGHVTIDVLDDGSRRAGGTAFYSALQAARLGRRVLIVTRGRPREVEALIEPHRGKLELELHVQPAAHTTTLRTRGSGSERSQSVLAWAGPIVAEIELDTSILHLAPVARESPSHWRGRGRFVGLTPQGLARAWDDDGKHIRSARPVPEAAELASRCHAVVVNEHERASCAELIAHATASGAVVAVTAGARPTTLLEPGRPAFALDVPAFEHPVDDLGAGDVFAAAFFIALDDGRSARDAVSFANAAAAVRIGGAGADAIGDLDAIETRLCRTA
jgi:sugar/nucleoside kinase (ribokinase family)